MDDIKVYSIHFSEKQVYVGSTVYSFDEKMKLIKNDKDHLFIFHVTKISKSRNSRRRF